jgi:4'-phosphopantetheinyl transferase
MEVFWFEQNSDDLPATDDWLSMQELACLRAFRFQKRAADWRLGRWTAKRALALCLSLASGADALASIEIVPAATGAPTALLAGKPSGWNISLTHTHGRAACALTRRHIALGCDLEKVEPRSDAFLADYFTPDEQKVFADASPRDRDLLATLFWSAKESAAKALQEGLRLDTRTLSVLRVGCPAPWSHWAPLTVAAAAGRTFHGWWRADGEYVATVASDPSCSLPIAPLAHKTQVLAEGRRGKNADAIAHCSAD